MSNIFQLLGMLGQGAPTSGTFNPSPSYNTPPIHNPNQGQSEVIPETIGTPITVDPAPEHKGLFGVKGTLRDMLGMAGDFRANMQGRTGRYEQLKQREGLSDAMRGYKDDPMTAIRRTFGVDPKLGQDMLEQYQEQEAKQRLEAQKRMDLGRGIVQSMAGTIKDDATYQKMMPLLKQTAKRYGVPDDELSPFFGDKYDKDTLAAYRYQGFPVDKQMSAEETARYHDLQDENADQRTGLQASRVAAQNSQGAARTSAYVKNTENQIERRNNPVAKPKAGGGTPRPAGVKPPPGFKLGKKLN